MWKEILFVDFLAILYFNIFNVFESSTVLVDKRSEPRPPERVPYVIVSWTATHLVQESFLPTLDWGYYITKQILPDLVYP